MTSTKKPRQPRKPRDLLKAEWLRPADIVALTGISKSTVYDMLTATGDARLPSVQYKGKGGRKGVRLVKRSEFDAFMARHAVKDTEASS